MPEADNTLTIHFDDDEGNDVILEGHHLSGPHGDIVHIATSHALLDIDQVQQLRDWLNTVLNTRKTKNTAEIVAAITAAAHRAEAAEIYAQALGMTKLNTLSFLEINNAITKRWSKSGLKYIKRQAWNIHDAKVMQRMREQETTPCPTA